jgi:DNA modification methylase
MGKFSTGWQAHNMPLNQMLLGDNLKLLALFPKGVFDFLYLDPPYYTQKDWGDFRDQFKSLQAYLDFMHARLRLCKEVMKPNAIICLQADYRAIHHLKCMMDQIFGYKNFTNELIWDRNGKGGYRSRRCFTKVHETILVYATGKRYCFNPIYDPFSKELLARYRHDDGDGKGPYSWQSLKSPDDPRLVRAGIKSGRYRFSQGGKTLYYKCYLNGRSGVPAGSVIKNIPTSGRHVRHGYATEKPEPLLEMLIRAFSNPGDVVLEPFCGSGTACAVAKRLCRKFIGLDMNPNAIKIARRRLKAII